LSCGIDGPDCEKSHLPDLTAPDDWLRSIEANPLVRRAERTVAADPSRNGLTTKVSGSGKCVVRKIVDERDEWLREPA
jgi:hypothetical protein